MVYSFYNFLGLMWDFLDAEGGREATHASRINLAPLFFAQISI
jgi:hypothetical protein